MTSPQSPAFRNGSPEAAKGGAARDNARSLGRSKGMGFRAYQVRPGGWFRFFAR